MFCSPFISPCFGNGTVKSVDWMKLLLLLCQILLGVLPKERRVKLIQGRNSHTSLQNFNMHILITTVYFNEYNTSTRSFII